MQNSTQARDAIIDQITELEVNEQVSLLSITDIYFDNLISNASDETIKRDIAFTKNKLTYLISNFYDN